MNKSSLGITPVWLLIWSLVLTLGWLLPNHYRPWTSFHSEVWVAFGISAIVPWAIVSTRPRFLCHGIESVVAVVALIPIFQFFFGQLPYFGQAWIASIYLFGFLISILAGRFLAPSNSGRLIDSLSLAIGVTSFVSVFLQLYQWLSLDGLGLWVAEADPRIPSANLGQRNQLATLLIWGLLAILWGWGRSSLGWVAALAGAMLILFGIALTGSRTAWVGLCLLVLAFWYWRHLWRSRLAPVVVTGLVIYFFCCVLILKLQLLGTITSVASPDVAKMEVARALSDSRLAAWRMFVGAALERPLFGYGWGQIAEAQLTVATQYPALNTIFSQSHNLFLDLVLWCGMPIGFLISGYLVFWIFRLARQIDSQESAVIFLFILVVANHSMFEFPMHYAYFLLPVGLLIGVLPVSESVICKLPTISKHVLTVLWGVGVSMLGVTVADYFKIEHSYHLLRMEWAGFNLEASPQPPKVIALTQWSHIIGQARVVPAIGMTDAELQELRIVTMQAHKPLDFRNLANALELNGNSNEAALWLERLCRVDNEAHCLMAREEFIHRKQ